MNRYIHFAGWMAVTANLLVASTASAQDQRWLLTVALDCVRDRAWPDACKAVQRVLDQPEDAEVLIRERDAAGNTLIVKSWAKFQANALIGSMPAEGLKEYEKLFGAKAANILGESLKKADLARMIELSQQYRHTQAGQCACVLLWCHFRLGW